jgi:DNA-binding IclR family transcriptional regulator
VSKKPGSADQNETRYNIRVLDRAFRVLSLLSDGKPRTLQELSEGIELSTSTTFRLLATLSYYRYISRDEQTNRYSLWLACLELARGFNESFDLRRIALPDLEALRDEVKETVHLGILDQMEIVYIEKLQGLHAIGLMSSRVGGRSPAYCTGIGKALLAFEKPPVVRKYFRDHPMHRYTDTTIITFSKLDSVLESVRSKGYALDHGEHEAEVRCVAAPIFDINDAVVAALSISGPAARLEPLEQQQDLIQKARQTASDISVKLGYPLKNRIPS